ncbi:hypothetical protein POM88_028788 [Heracleum sosnowskyi]|uniref:CCHC-type domain-containing protein n=1 Tax=Heracleum sosnowskyi TaxID=360622 RepID=A0AAD8HV04_9APIA|nr:hypothetical protein POM88_028788 [Heracleum sosnowskyi]
MEWINQQNLIRHTDRMNLMTLDEIYGILKTYELEIKQKEGVKSKSKSVALKTELKEKHVNQKKMKAKARVAVESDTNTDADASTDEESEDDSDKELVQMVAMMVKGFRKMKYGKFRKYVRTSKGNQYSNKKSKFKKNDLSKVKCFNCDKMGHYATDCKKPKNGKASGKALVTSSKGWMDSSDSEEEEEVNYALMVEIEEISKKVPETTYAFDTNNMYVLRSFLKTMHISYNNQSKENIRILSEVADINKRNDYLETELVVLTDTKNLCDKLKRIEIKQMLKIESLEKELKKEREQIRVWTHSGKQAHLLMNDKNWKKCLGYKENKEKEKEKVTLSTHIKFVPESEMKNNSSFEEGSSSSTKVVSEEEMTEELVFDIEIESISSEQNKTPVSKTSTEISIKTHAKISTESAKKSVKKEKNIGHLSSGKLKKKISAVTGIKNEKIPKRHRNGKQGIDKSNGYKYIPNAPRKTCHTCGHMTGNKSLLSDFEKKAGPKVSYGDGNIGHTLGYGNIVIGNVIIQNVALVEGLKHNLLSISQITDRGYHVNFYESHCEITSKKDGKVILTGYRRGNIYEANLHSATDGTMTCLLSKASVDESWNWHKKLSHLNFNNINELVRKDLV